MADEQLDPTQPAAPAADVSEPAQEPAPDVPAVDPAASDVQAVSDATEPQAVPDPSGDTPSTSPDPSEPSAGEDEPAPVEAPVEPVAQPVIVDNHTVRSDDDALLGSWVDVVSGPLAGRFGSYVDTVHYDKDTGYPSVILIRSRDARNELLEVAYSDVRPSERSGGR